MFLQFSQSKLFSEKNHVTLSESIFFVFRMTLMNFWNNFKQFSILVILGWGICHDLSPGGGRSRTWEGSMIFRGNRDGITLHQQSIKWETIENWLPTANERGSQDYNRTLWGGSGQFHRAWHNQNVRDTIKTCVTQPNFSHPPLSTAINNNRSLNGFISCPRPWQTKPKGGELSTLHTAQLLKQIACFYKATT